MDFLKDAIGEDLYNKVKEALKDKNVKIADLSKGEYVSIDKYNSALESEKQIRQQLSERDNQLKGLQKLTGDNEALNKRIEEMQNENKLAKENFEKSLHETKKNYALDSYLKDNKVKNTKAFKALLDNDIITYKDDKLNGIEDQIKRIKETDGYLFDLKSEQIPTGTGGAPPISNNQPNLNQNEFKFDNFTPIRQPTQNNK